MHLVRVSRALYNCGACDRSCLAWRAAQRGWHTGRLRAHPHLTWRSTPDSVLHQSFGRLPFPAIGRQLTVIFVVRRDEGLDTKEVGSRIRKAGSLHTSSGVTGRWLVFLNSSITRGSRLRSFLHPTRIIGSPAQKCITSEIHCEQHR